MKVGKRKMKKILLCCSAGASSSILVKSMRNAAKKYQVDCVIAATSITQLQQYISKARRDVGMSPVWISQLF